MLKLKRKIRWYKVYHPQFGYRRVPVRVTKLGFLVVKKEPLPRGRALKEEAGGKRYLAELAGEV